MKNEMDMATRTMQNMNQKMDYLEKKYQIYIIIIII